MPLTIVFPLKTISRKNEEVIYECDVDEIDKPTSSYRVAAYEICLFKISIIFHILDVIIDLNIAIQYLKKDNILYFWCTLMFIFIPAVINTAFSVTMYINEDERQNSFKRTLKWKIFAITVFILQLAPILHYCKALRYAKKCRQSEKAKHLENQKKYYQLMVKEDCDLALLRVIECFLEAAPQQILQITILLLDYGKGLNTIDIVHNLASICSSFITMAWTLASYHRSIRFAQKSKLNISSVGTCLLFVWHISVTISRILSLSILASTYPLPTCIGVLIHWMVMTLWISFTEKWYFCNKQKVLDFLVQAIFGLVYVFTFISLSDGKTKKKYIFFYLICFFENLAAVLLWLFAGNSYLNNTIYCYIVISLIAASFVVGISVMIVYYKWHHPIVKYATCKRVTTGEETNGTTVRL